MLQSATVVPGTGRAPDTRAHPKRNQLNLYRKEYCAERAKTMVMMKESSYLLKKAVYMVKGEKVSHGNWQLLNTSKMKNEQNEKLVSFLF